MIGEQSYRRERQQLEADRPRQPRRRRELIGR
jgi:hypothetical protein